MCGDRESRVSFDVVLRAFRDGAPVAGDREGIRQALVGVRRFLSDSDWHLLETADGGSMELALDALDEDDVPLGIDAGVSVRTWTPQVVALIYHVALLGGMAIAAPLPGIDWILTAPDQGGHLPPAEDPARTAKVYCGSAAGLGELLAPAFPAWAACRDRRAVEASED